ncbi:hypothetical protein HMPREF1989_00448 [Porphyromonas gingivalis F0566]|nr:hypothetical protein HMPREF1553_01704 [Porphyromonas gingivalis F0568]ERJ88051.1 hypothetical protein HMPREF1989_00448 [Porphyromonas gingivalis F0566]
MQWEKDFQTHTIRYFYVVNRGGRPAETLSAGMLSALSRTKI